MVFFCHGELTKADRAHVRVRYSPDEGAELFQVPLNTKIFDYDEVESSEEEEKSENGSDEKRKEQREMAKIQDLARKVEMRHELVRGDRVQPETVCYPCEGCPERPDFSQMFNGVMMGGGLMNLKVTVTQDLVDCGLRKVVEEVAVDKYHDYEAFTFSQVVQQLRAKLDSEVYLRIHLISCFTFDRKFELAHSVDEEIRQRESVMEAHQLRKRNSFLDLLTAFTSEHPVPTQNADLINVHEKNISLHSRVDALQRTTKEFLLKNLQLNTRHEAEKKKLRVQVKDLTQELEELREREQMNVF